MQKNTINHPELILDLPYISADLPGIGGQLRSSPDHFIVEELPLYEPSGEGQHLYVNLTKRELTTREVQGQLAKLFNVPLGEVGFAGMKDKHAQTTQTFSVNVGLVDDAYVQGAFGRLQEHLSAVVHWVKLHRNKLKRGHLLGNRFTIIVTQPDVTGEDGLRYAEAIVGRLKNGGLPNYYGPQRLGQHGSNVHRGFELILSQRRMKERWLQDLLKASVQSYLCNRYLARRVEESLFDSLLLGDIAKKYDTGGLFEVKDVAIEQPRHEAKEVSFTAPVYGPKMWFANGTAAEFETEILRDAGLTIAQLDKARLSGTRRLGRLLLDDIEIAATEDGIAVSFSLPKGAFATTVLREIMKVDDSELAAAPADDSD